MRRRRFYPMVTETTAARCGSMLMPAAPSSGILCIRCSCRRLSARTSTRLPTDQAVISHVLDHVRPKIFAYLESQIAGKYLVGDTMTLADIAIVSNFVVYQYMGFEIDGGRYPKLAQYLRGIMATASFQRALADEKPFVEQMGLKRDFLAAVA